MKNHKWTGSEFIDYKRIKSRKRLIDVTPVKKYSDGIYFFVARFVEPYIIDYGPFPTMKLAKQIRETVLATII